ncbi:hypothetical protein CJF26_21350, partial [Photobacterium phosphoreum]|nr:hypothetical protein [Photobacterium phosphoreum]
MIFSFSLLLLWNNWQTHNGNPSLFGGSSVATTQEKTTTPPADASIPTAVDTGAAIDNTVPGDKQPVASTSEKVKLKTDVFDLPFD